MGGTHLTMAVGHDVLVGISPVGRVQSSLLLDNIQRHNNPCGPTLLLRGEVLLLSLCIQGKWSTDLMGVPLELET